MAIDRPRRPGDHSSTLRLLDCRLIWIRCAPAAKPATGPSGRNPRPRPQTSSQTLSEHPRGGNPQFRLSSQGGCPSPRGQDGKTCRRAEAGGGAWRRWSGRRDSNPRPTAWKAVTLPLSYSRRFRLQPPGAAAGERLSVGGGGWIRTTVGISPADLQSAAIVHSATPPRSLQRTAADAAIPLPVHFPSPLEPAPGLEPRTY